MKLEFYGGADTVTGTMHHVTAGGISILFDCGFFQGRREDTFTRNKNLPAFARQADCMILSHAHIDHCGNIPNLVKQGFQGNIYCTPATRDLASLMLQDSAHIQEQDAYYLNKRMNKKDPARKGKIEPIYNLEDALAVLQNFITVPYTRRFQINKQVSFTLYDAGHILGSSMILLEEREGQAVRRLLFTGDLGRPDMPILNNPFLLENIDYLIVESTYGNRKHEERAQMDLRMQEEINRVVQNRGKLFIPSFSLERAQEILLSIATLEKQKKIPVLPVYLDSPLAIAITDVFRLHPECFDEELLRMVANKDLPFFTSDLTKVHSIQMSKNVMEKDESSIIIAGSACAKAGEFCTTWPTACRKRTIR